MTRRDSVLNNVRVDHSHYRDGRNLIVDVRSQEEMDLVIDNLDELPKIECESEELTQSIMQMCKRHRAVFSKELNREAAQS